MIFDENTVEEAGAAIYASDIGVCTYIPDESVCIVEGSDEYRKSIFQQVPFSFRYIIIRVSLYILHKMSLYIL